jgi:hypothetical protein
MPRVRGTFKVIEQTRWDWNRKAAQVKLEAVVGKDEADEINVATNCASVTMLITNPKLVTLFAPGKHFAVDFTAVAKPRVKREPKSLKEQVIARKR